MTRFALAVLVWSPCALLLADDPKKPPTDLEGAWQEPTLPGEDVAVRYRIIFSGDKVTIRHREQVLTGIVKLNPLSTRITFTMMITNVEGKGAHGRGIHTGIYEVVNDRISIQFNPTPVRLPDEDEIPAPRAKNPQTGDQPSPMPVPTVPGVVVVNPSRSRIGMDLAPVTLTLHKVAK
jgi:hypothetical protein